MKYKIKLTCPKKPSYSNVTGFLLRVFTLSLRSYKLRRVDFCFIICTAYSYTTQKIFLRHLVYTDESNPIVQSNKLVAYCEEKDIIAERLFGEKEILYSKSAAEVVDMV